MILAFTGHRPGKLGGYDITNLTAFAKKILIETKPATVISGLALGWDSAVADAAIELDIPLIGAVPFAGQPARWRDEDKALYAKRLAACHNVVIVCPGNEYHARKMKKRNRWMVRNSQALIALWDGSDGGTASCCRYAVSIGHPVVNVWERWKNDH